MERQLVTAKSQSEKTLKNATSYGGGREGREKVGGGGGRGAAFAQVSTLQ